MHRCLHVVLNGGETPSNKAIQFGPVTEASVEGAPPEMVSVLLEVLEIAHNNVVVQSGEREVVCRLNDNELFF